MGSKWKTALLTDHYDISSGLSKPAKDFGSGYPFLSFKDVFYNYFVPDKLTELVETSVKEQMNCSVKRGDLFLTRTSETMHELGMSSVALKNYDNATFNGFCKRLRPKQDSDLVPEYVGYYLRSPKFRQRMLAFSTMSTRASLNNEMIGHLEITYPEPAIQQKIADILFTLDKKITLNRQINQTLEQMAQTLFKSWFVDFDPVIDNALDAGNEIPEPLQARAELRQQVRASQDFQPLPAEVRTLFPAEFEESELGWVPKGWMVNYLNESTNIVYGKNLSTSKVLEVGYPVYGGNGIIGFYDQFLYKHQQVLVSCRGAASGKVHLSKPYAYVTNNSLIIENNSLPVYYLYQYLLTQDLTSLTSGSAQPQMTIANMNPVQILIPSNNILDIYTQHTTGFYEFVLKSEAATESLIQLRDTLLPKLISGELRLDNLSDEVVTAANE